jgi:hypothetical protein
VTFDWKTNIIKNDIGMIAEEVNEILPTIVQKDNTGQVQGLDYSRIVAVLTAAVQELSAELKDVKAQLAELKK